MRTGSLGVFTLLSILLACDGGGLPDGHRLTPDGTGPQVRWDIEAEPLPEIPIPNDVATWPDPSSPTGFRINASLLVPTNLERHTRDVLNRLDGWGTFSPITVPFTDTIDTQDLYDRQGGLDNFSQDDWPDHAIYLIDMETGIPHPIDINGGAFHFVLNNPNQYFENDPRAGESNILFETVDEDMNNNGLLDPGEDTDFDGVLDVPNTFSGALNQSTDTVDEMMWFYETETDTLILKPSLPLRERSKYAVVITERVRGAATGAPVRSSLDHTHHVTQMDDLAPLEGFFEARPDFYGDLAEDGWNGVAFAWTFTTQSVTTELTAVREGLNGRGVFDRLADEFPADIALHPMLGENVSFNCPDPGAEEFRLPGDAFARALAAIPPGQLDLTAEQVEEMAGTFANLAYVVVASFDSPYLMGDPSRPELFDTWDVDTESGEGRFERETLTMTIFVPKETEEYRQPFPTAFYVHGYGSANAEVLPFAGLLVSQGVATIVMNAYGHGLEVSGSIQTVVTAIFANECAGPAGDAIIAGRAKDLNGDGELNSGGDFWTSYVFHTRDVVRQTAVDHMQAIRIIRSFDGRTPSPVTMTLAGQDEVSTFDGDSNFDGTIDAMGDFNGDGIVDIAGPDNPIYFTGGSLGGIISGVLAALEPSVTVSVPIVGAGGLADVGIRTDNGGVLRAVALRLMGPLVTGVLSDGPDRDTSCPAGDISLGWTAPDVKDFSRTEFACLASSSLSEQDVIIVRNLTNGEVGCSGSVADVGRFRVSLPSDANDRVTVELYLGARDEIDFAECTFAEPRDPDDTIDTWRVANDPDNCRDCARFQTRVYEQGESLRAPTAGFGRARQTPSLRRLLTLAQIGFEPGDPVNYARHVFLEPLEFGDGRSETAHNLLVMNTIGDNNVPIAGGNMYARAAGIIPFIPPDGPDEYMDFRAPEFFEELYPGNPTPHHLLFNNHVLEGVHRLNRHSAGVGAEDFLFDVDDLDDGRLRFQPDGTQDPDGFDPVTLERPLRWVRASRAMRGSWDTVWSPEPGEPVSGVLNVYSLPQGVHGFDFGTILNPTAPFDVSQYMVNMLGRYAASNGTDLHYRSNPDGHHCLEDSSCPFIAGN